MNIEVILANYDFSQVQVLKSIAPLLLAGLIVGAISLAVGIYTFLQMRKMQKKNRPKPNQIDGTIADEGVSFCDIAGSPHIHPNITDLWNKKSEAIKQKSGGFLGIGKTSQVTGYRYYTSFAAFIGNRIEKFIAINFDNRGWIVHDPEKHPSNMLPVNKPSLFGQDAGGVAGDIDIEFGYPQPQQNLAYKQHFDLVSAYPYQSYLVFRGNTIDQPFYFGNSNYMKEMLLWVKRIHVKNDGGAQWHDAKAEIGDYATRYYVEPFFERDYLSYVGPNGPEKLYGARIVDVDFNHSAASAPCTFSFTAGSGAPMQFKLYVRVRGGTCSLTSYPVKTTYSIQKQDEGLGIVGYWFTFTLEQRNPEKLNFSFLCNINETPPHDPNLQSAYQMYIGQEPEVESGWVYDAMGQDINPIHKIREILTDDTAMAKPEADVNDQNFTKAAERVWDDGLGVSWAIDEKSCIDAIEELCYHVEAGIRVNRQTGLYEMVLFRDDWFAEDEIHTITENKIKDLSLEVMNSDDIVNQLNVTYYDRERIKNSTFSIYENGSILTMGKANAESIDFPYFMNIRNAEIVANWKLKQYSTPAWKGTITTGWREARKWNRYDLVKINWSKKWQGTILARIMKIDLGNGLNNEVMIDFEEVVPYSGEMNTSIVVDDSAEEKAEPAKPAIGETFEAPYYIAVQNIGQRKIDEELAHNPDVGFTFSTYRRPQWNALYAEITTANVDKPEDGWIIDGNAEFVTSGQFDQLVSRTATQITVKNLQIEDYLNPNDLIVVGTWLSGEFGSYEFMIVESLDIETSILTVKRGALDTIPRGWDNGMYFFRSNPDDGLFSLTEYSADQNVRASSLTVTPSSKLEHLGSAPVYMRSRAIRPYPPANVKINGEYWPEEIETDLILTWADRNRLNLLVSDWYSSDSNMEPYAETHIVFTQFNSQNSEVSSQSFDIEPGLHSHVIPLSTINEETRFAIIEMYTMCNGNRSYYSFSHRFNINLPFSAPFNLTARYEQ